ncbi:MAG: plasmid pRiA4b ORF-3 family protein [Variovorax sp.]|nr:MAG: plasmid pRiA4b ORF-3 family protein [Variovorax sp.]
MAQRVNHQDGRNASPGELARAPPDTDAHRIFIGDLTLRRPERFAYEYDFGDSWIHDLRVEVTLPVDPGLGYPLCTAGRGAAPPEDCGGAQVFMANRSLYAVIGGGESHAQL